MSKGLSFGYAGSSQELGQLDGGPFPTGIAPRSVCADLPTQIAQHEAAVGFWTFGPGI